MFFLLPLSIWVAAYVYEIYEKAENSFITPTESPDGQDELTPTKTGLEDSQMSDPSVDVSVSSHDIRKRSDTAMECDNAPSINTITATEENRTNISTVACDSDTLDEAIDSGYDSSSSVSDIDKDEKEPFPSPTAFEQSEDEFEAMNNYHGYTGLLLQRPLFIPDDVTGFDVIKAAKIPLIRDLDIFFHRAEAQKGFAHAVQFACCFPQSRYKLMDPAFTAPTRTENHFSSQFTSEVSEYIVNTHAGPNESIRVVNAYTLTCELITCLSFSFIEYVTSPNFRESLSSFGKNTIVPEPLTPLIEAALDGNPRTFRHAIDCCAKKLVDGGKFFEMWQCWMYVLRHFVALLVLKHQNRNKEDVSWV